MDNESASIQIIDVDTDNDTDSAYNSTNLDNPPTFTRMMYQIQSRSNLTDLLLFYAATTKEIFSLINETKTEENSGPVSSSDEEQRDRKEQLKLKAQLKLKSKDELINTLIKIDDIMKKWQTVLSRNKRQKNHRSAR